MASTARVTDELVDALAQTSFLVMEVLTRTGAAHDLSLTQLRVLGVLRDRRLRMAELAGYLGLEKSTISGLVDRAEQRGLLARARSADDGRAVEVFMTAEGRRLAQRVEADIREALIPATEQLSATQLRTLAQLLGQLSQDSLRSIAQATMAESR
jgi:DNA-binding MarR family transcriptional regulator